MLFDTKNKSLGIAMSERLCVTNIKSEGLYKKIYLNNGKSFEVTSSTSLDIEDQITISAKKIFAHCQNGVVEVYPHYEEKEIIVIGEKKLVFLIKEITTDEELRLQKELSALHYRNEICFGKDVKLILTLENEPLLPKVIGYIELNLAPITNRSRNIFLNGSYNDGYIHWSNWDFEARGKYSKAIVTISRVVVHPDFRGLGLSNMLLKHSFKFAATRWKCNGVKPVFIEIVAEMLKFVPFVTKAGMYYIGDTEGNLSRLKRDIKFYLNNRNLLKKNKDSSALIRLQFKYIRNIETVLKENNLTPAELLNLIYSNHWEKTRDKLLKNLIRSSKPTFIAGLTDYSKLFIKRRLNELGIKEFNKKPTHASIGLWSPIEIKNISMSFKFNKKDSNRTKLIKEIFGIKENSLETKVLSDFSLKINPGEIILITGQSGSGKTTLLNLISGKLNNKTGTIKLPLNFKPGFLQPLEDKKAIIDLIGKDAKEAVDLLSNCGLSEAYIYLKKFSELSNGQKYRAMLAKLLSMNVNVIIADEFLGALDFINSNIIARKIRKISKELGITFIVASSNPENFIDSLMPDKIIIKDLVLGCRFL